MRSKLPLAARWRIHLGMVGGSAGQVERGRPERGLPHEFTYETLVVHSSSSFKIWPQNYSACLPLGGGFTVLSLLESGQTCEGFSRCGRSGTVSRAKVGNKGSAVSTLLQDPCCWSPRAPWEESAGRHAVRKPRRV